ncbi:MAG: hypothetical protein ACLP3C_17310 [Mycobacterium sp.]|uniref:hypothetical protein n=1 Tax=Mycobacterium sp. TaxID=1785 RepID=UPI003F9564E9
MPADIRVAPSDIAELLDDLAHAPHLPGARCRGQAALFDATIGGTAPKPQVAQARRQAIKICATCPCLQACSQWLDTLDPYTRPLAVTAGRPPHQLPPKPVDVFASVRKDPGP